VLDDAWVNEFVWSRDSRSIYFQANDGTFGRGERMFDQPVARVSIDDGRAERIASGATVDFSISLSRDGRRMAYKAVEGRTMGDVVVLDVRGMTLLDPPKIEAEINQLAGVVTNGIFARRPADVLLLAEPTGTRTITAPRGR